MKTAANNYDPKWVLLLFYLLGVILICWLSSCKGCNEPLPVKPSAPDVIKAQAKPKEDSLIQVVKNWQLKYDSLAAAFKRREIPRKSSQTKVVQSIDEVKDIAIREGCDSVLAKLVETRKKFDEYVDYTDKQLATRGQMIEAKDSTIAASYARVELKKSMFASLSKEYIDLDKQFEAQAKDLAKTQRKLKRAKFLNKVFIPGAIIMGSALGVLIL